MPPTSLYDNEGCRFRWSEPEPIDNQIDGYDDSDQSDDTRLCPRTSLRVHARRIIVEVTGDDAQNAGHRLNAIIERY